MHGFWLTFIAVGAVHGAGLGQVPMSSCEDMNRRLEWVEKAGIPENVYLEIEQTYWFFDRDDGRDAATFVADVEREAAGRPEHPLLQDWKYQVASREVQHGPQVTRYRLWYGDPERWRTARDLGEGHPIRTRDSGHPGTGDAWAINGDQLVYLDLDHLPDGHQYPTMTLDVVVQNVKLLRYSAFGNSGAAVRCTEFVQHESSWSATLRDPDGMATVLVRGTVDDMGISWPETSRVTSASNKQAVGLEFRHDEWQHVSAMAEPLASTMVAVNVRGQLVEKVRLIEVRKLSDTELMEAVRMPEPGGRDIIRDMTQVATVIDYRPGRMVAKSVETGKTAVIISKSARWGWARPLGWAICGFLVIGILVFRLVRSRGLGN